MAAFWLKEMELPSRRMRERRASSAPTALVGLAYSGRMRIMLPGPAVTGPVERKRKGAPVEGMAGSYPELGMAS